jgi:hypothetical protein
MLFSRKQIAGFALLGALIGIWISPGRGVALDANDPNQQPYGGCAEAWQAPQSEGAEWCRSRGWVVRRAIVVSPRNWVRYYALPTCRYEDGSGGPLPCQWNFAKPPSAGMDYWITGTHQNPAFHYVNGVR